MIGDHFCYDCGEVCDCGADEPDDCTGCDSCGDGSDDSDSDEAEFLSGRDLGDETD